jgi:Holliday junction DNA helicase RuvB
VYRLNFYDQSAIEVIIARSTRLLGIEAEKRGLEEIAKRARGTPRVANRLLKRVRDYAQVKGKGVITEKIALEALGRLEIDPIGLDEVDHKILRTIIEKFNGGPVGLDTIAAAISEEADTIMDVYEPYLLQLSFLERTPRGRLATRFAYEHLELPYPKGKPDQPSLL